MGDCFFCTIFLIFQYIYLFLQIIKWAENNLIRGGLYNWRMSGCLSLLHQNLLYSLNIYTDNQFPATCFLLTTSCYSPYIVLKTVLHCFCIGFGSVGNAIYQSHYIDIFPITHPYIYIDIGHIFQYGIDCIPC